VSLALVLLIAATTAQARSDTPERPYKDLCSEVRYELAQQVEEGLLEPSTADQINRRCDAYTKQAEEQENKRPWWE